MAVADIDVGTPVTGRFEAVVVNSVEPRAT